MMGRKLQRRGRGEGTITQLPDGRWRARLSLGKRKDGKRRRRVFYGKTKAEVLEKLRKAQAEQGHGLESEASTLTVAAWLDRWLEMKKANVEPNTYHWYERRIRLHLKPTIGDVRLVRLTALNVLHMHEELTQQGVSAGEQRNAATTLRAALKDAVRLRLVAINVAKDVDKPKKVKRREMLPLDLGQARAFLAAAVVDRLFALYALALDSGMRPGELFGLHWDDVDWAAGSVSIRHSLEEISGKPRLKEPKTAAARRTILLGKMTVEALRGHRERMAKEGRDVDAGPVFVNTEGGWLLQANFYRRSFLKVLERAKLPHVRPYDLRHTCATLLLSKDVNVKVVSERLGHEDITVTLKHYAHALPSMQEKAVRAIEELFGSEWAPDGHHVGKKSGKGKRHKG
jgi:integrase